MSIEYGLYNPGVAPDRQQRMEEDLKLLRSEICLLRDDIKSLRDLVMSNKRSQKPRCCKRKPTE